LTAGKNAMLSKIKELQSEVCSKTPNVSINEGLPTFLNALRTCSPKPIAYI
jgi:hypothetical protein